MDVDNIYKQVRTLVEQVQDNLVIQDERGLRRTPDGDKLSRVLFGLDIMKKVVGDYYVRREDSDYKETANDIH